MSFSTSYEAISVKPERAYRETRYECKHCKHTEDSVFKLQKRYFENHVFAERALFGGFILLKFDTKDAIDEYCRWYSTYITNHDPGWYVIEDSDSQLIYPISLWIPEEAAEIDERIKVLRQLKAFVGYREEEWYLVDCEGRGCESCNLKE